MYGRVYPLYTPAGFLLPFQILREPLRELTPMTLEDMEQGSVPKLWDDGYIVFDWAYSLINDTIQYDVSGISRIYVENLPPAEVVTGADYYANVVFTDDNDDVVSYLNLGNFFDSYTGYIDVPAGASYMYLYSKVGATDEKVESVGTNPRPIEECKIFASSGELYADVSANIIPYISIQSVPGYDCIIYGSKLPFLSSMPDGQYYAVMTDGVNIWYSEIFTVVNDITPYLKIEWWDEDDFVMDAGTIVYKYNGGQFKNVLYLQADIAKPEYIFEDEGETRDGYFFPSKQISEKRYRFSFLASEYLLDVMRFIRMADYVRIEKNGQEYAVDSFLITPEWESNGDIATVDAEFDTATVAKKIGRVAQKISGGDFNNDFNKDFNK